MAFCVNAAICMGNKSYHNVFNTYMPCNCNICR
jgi:hypothetical protein